MKVSLIALIFLLILAALHSEANEELVNELTISPCCLAFISRSIPLRFVKSYQRTGDHCLTPGIIFFTHKGRQICANPNVAWVQEYIRHLDSLPK